MGLVQMVKLDLSTLHSKWSTPPVSVPENAKVIEVDLVMPPLVRALLLPFVAEFIEVAGGVVSTVQVNVDGDGSVFPTLSTALRCRMWVPSFRLLNLIGLVHVTKFELSILH